MATSIITINQALDAPAAGIVPRAGMVTFRRLNVVVRTVSGVTYQVDPKPLVARLSAGLASITLENGYYEVDPSWADRYAINVTANALLHDITHLDLGSLDPEDPDTVAAWADRPTRSEVTAAIAPGQYDVVAGRPAVFGDAGYLDMTADAVTLQAAFDACPQGGSVFIKGRYRVKTTPIVRRSGRIIGAGCTPVYIARSEPNSSTSIPQSLAGTVIEVNAEGIDGLDIRESSISPDLRDFGIEFKAGLASTGHGINALVSKPYTAIDPSGHDMGPTDFMWERLSVLGHDGNHYGYAVRNPQYGTVIHPRSWGGGGWWLQADKGPINSGNIKFFHPYVSVYNAGTADGWRNDAAGSTHPGRLNLVQVYSPQINVTRDAATAAVAGGGQKIWNDFGGAVTPAFVQVYNADFENIVNVDQIAIGPDTEFAGGHYINNYVNRLITGTQIGKGAGGKLTGAMGQFVAIGYQALAEATAVQRLVAVGFNALQKMNVDYSTGVGNQAGKFQTGRVTALGADALLGASGLSTGSQETAIGYRALASLQTGDKNTAIGESALSTPQAVSESTAVGSDALHGTTGSTGTQNVGVGTDVMYNYTTGDKNLAAGYRALRQLTTGVQNVALGYDSGNSPGGVAANGLQTGNNNVLVGYQTGASATHPTPAALQNAVHIGWRATGRDNSVAIGAGATAEALGSVAIGRDSGGTAASTTTQNEFALGTPLHLITVAGRLNVARRTPSGVADAQGRVGDITSDDGYVYAKTSTGWKRAALNPFTADTASTGSDAGPVDLGFLGWTVSPVQAASTFSPTAGQIVYAEAIVRADGAISTVGLYVGTAGATVANAYLAIFDTSGNQLGISADISSALSSTTGVKQISLLAASTAQTKGTRVLVALLVGSAGTMPVIAKASVTTGLINRGRTAATGYHCGSYGSGFTAMPSTLTLSTSGNSNNLLYADIA